MANLIHFKRCQLQLEQRKSARHQPANMLLSLVGLSVILLYNQVTSDKLSDSIWRTMANQTIEVNQYCKTNKCLVKCCPAKQFIVRGDKGPKCIKTKYSERFVRDTNVSVYKWHEASARVLNTGALIHNQFEFIQSDFLTHSNNTHTVYGCEFYILEDGSLYAKSNNSRCLDVTLAAREYCVDWYFTGYQPGTKVPRAALTYRTDSGNDPNAKIKHDFLSAGMLVSCVFMALVLAVYSALPKLQNIVGMILMAYLLTLIATYALKAAQLVALNLYITPQQCQDFTPVVYYFMMASFFWLNVMSFDLWWTIRGSRKRREIHRRGELVKFGWYALYAWGAPAALALAVLAVDRLRLYRSPADRPPFLSCFANIEATVRYVHIPIGVMTAANWALFLMTAYNVWRIKRDVTSSTESRNTKNSEYRFAIYVKLCVLMGISWVLEVVPHPCLALYILLNFFNVFIGVAIFIIFVCKKDVFRMLCKRFHIKKRYQQSSQYSRSESSSFHKKSRRQREQDEDDQEMRSN